MDVSVSPSSIAHPSISHQGPHSRGEQASGPLHSTRDDYSPLFPVRLEGSSLAFGKVFSRALKWWSRKTITCLSPLSEPQVHGRLPSRNINKMYNKRVFFQHQRVKSKVSCEYVSAHIPWRGRQAVHKVWEEGEGGRGFNPTSEFRRKSHLVRNQV